MKASLRRSASSYQSKARSVSASERRARAIGYSAATPHEAADPYQVVLRWHDQLRQAVRNRRQAEAVARACSGRLGSSAQSRVLVATAALLDQLLRELHGLDPVVRWSSHEDRALHEFLVANELSDLATWFRTTFQRLPKCVSSSASKMPKRGVRKQPRRAA